MFEGWMVRAGVSNRVVLGIQKMVPKSFNTTSPCDPNTLNSCPRTTAAHGSFCIRHYELSATEIGLKDFSMG